MNKRLTPEEFINIYQTAKYIEDVEEKTGMNRVSIKSRAHKYVNIFNIPLNRLPSKKKRGLDVETLRKLATQIKP